MTRQAASAYSWPAIITLMLAALSLNVAAAPCDPDESKWAPSRYYPAGAVVHHDGEWYHIGTPQALSDCAHAIERGWTHAQTR